jgi:hypothetical protein
MGGRAVSLALAPTIDAATDGHDVATGARFHQRGRDTTVELRVRLTSGPMGRIPTVGPSVILTRRPAAGRSVRQVHLPTAGSRIER